MLQMKLYGPDGRPISSDQYSNKKAQAPKLGASFGDWAGRDVQYMTLPGGAVVQFDLNKLTLADYRVMRDHYQINASLAVLSFMQHQSDFHIECDNKKIADFCNDQLHENWTQLNRAMSTANWAGFAPNALEWDNDFSGRRVILSKIKDLHPEECAVNWKTVDGWAPPGEIPPKFKVYDGIRQLGQRHSIPVENSFWFPLLMEQGDYYGRKLLRPAFQSWFFSILLHLFANRYMERFGEPVPVGRAPFDEPISVNGTDVPGNQYMLGILQALRSRSAVVLPNLGSEDRAGKMHYDYTVEFLESQMRGADFERYMTRLDEEMSIGLFTPILLLRTADVGSYNLGVGHMQMYLWMLNAMNSDRALYINKYILNKMTDYNFGPNAPRPRIIFRKLGNTDTQTLRDVLTALIGKDKIKPDIAELGQMTGMTLEEVEQTVAEPSNVPAKESAAPDDDAEARGGAGNQRGFHNRAEISATVKEITDRVRGQVESAFRDGRFNAELKLNMGYKRKFERALGSHSVKHPIEATNRLYGKMDHWLADTVTLGQDAFSNNPDSFLNLFSAVLSQQVEEIS